MAQQTTADESRTEAQNDPELAAATMAEAATSLEIHLTRDGMREACREWGLDGYSGTKAEMAAAMLEQAEERSLALLAEEGVELLGDLADDEADEAAEEAAAESAEDEDEGEDEDERLAAPEDVPAEIMDEVAQEYGMGAGAVKGSLAFMDEGDAEVDSEADEAAMEARRRTAEETPEGDLPSEQEAEAQDEDDSEDSEDSSQDTPGSLAQHLLARDPEDYGYTAKLQMTEKQTAACQAAFENLDAAQDEVAEAADCTTRYANSTLNRWRGAQDEVQAMEDAGVDVPAEYVGITQEGGN